LTEPLENYNPKSIDMNLLPELAPVVIESIEMECLADLANERQNERDRISLEKSLEENFLSRSKEWQEELSSWANQKKTAHLKLERQKEKELELQFVNFWNSLD
jgi:hypothetical protein